MMPALVAKNLTKTYRSGTKALNGLSLEVQHGEIFCVVGPNGAGKTTLMRSLATQLLPDSGELTILGHDALKRPDEVRRRIAAVPQGGYPDSEVTPWEHLMYYLGARGMARSQARTVAEQTLKYLNLWEKRDTIVGHLSGGMARRVLLAMALAAGTELIILDEPTVGLDPEVRRDTWSLIARLKERATILFTTHNMEEAEVLADRVALVSKGQVLACGTPADLRAVVTSHQKVLLPTTVDLARVTPFGKVESYAGKWVVYPSDTPAMQRLVADQLERGISVLVQPTNLEDAYIACLRAQREEIEAAERLGTQAS